MPTRCRGILQFACVTLYLISIYRAFHPLLEKLAYAMERGLLHQEDEAKFLETAVIFAHHAAEFLRNHRTYIANDDTMVVQMEYILR